MLTRKPVVAALLGIVVALVMLVLIAYLDRTNLGTTNGLNRIQRAPRTYAEIGHGKRPGGKYCGSRSHT